MRLRGTVPNNMVVSFGGRVSSRVVKDCWRRGIRAAELRVDLLGARGAEAVLKELQKLGGLWVIATVRSRQEGGRWTGSEAERLELFKKILPHANAVDIELSSAILKKVVRAARARRKTVIVSYHNFKRTPPAAVLSRIEKRARVARADIVKIAAMAKSNKDIRTLERFLVSARHKPLVIIAMGKIGGASRLYFPKLGSRLVYVSSGRPTAPGQWNYRSVHVAR